MFRSLRKSASSNRSQRRTSKFRPHLEVLEDLTLPAVTFLPTHLMSSNPIQPQAGPGPSGMTPAQVRHAYGFDQISFQNGTVVGNGAGQTIAIVDAYDDPSIAADLAVFDQQFGLATPASFSKVGISANGTASTSTFPAADAGWAGEIELDVEWAHAIAPAANILLVEANSASDADLLRAVDFARSQPGVSTVSLSWGASEFSGESSYDNSFTTPAGHGGVTFLGSSGDSGSPAIWPAFSSHVVAVGGTSLNVDAVGNYLSESGWSGSGGSISSYVTAPSFQAGLVIHNGTAIVSAGGHRTAPDVAYDSAPNTGFSVYGSFGWNGWATVGGTSDAAPQWAGLFAIANQGRALGGLGSLDGYSQALPAIYALPATDFHDVASGGNGGYSAGPGYDLVTGRGTPFANLVVRDLVGTGGTGTTGQPPTVASAARIVSQTATTANLAVLGADAGGEASLTYTWTLTAGPGGVSTSANGTNAAKNATMTFTQTGSYTFQVTITNTAGRTATSQVTVAIAQVSTSVSVTPGSVTVAQGATQAFSAKALDQFGAALTTQPNFAWSVGSTQGTITSAGLFTASATATGSTTVRATTGSLSATATVTFAAPPPATGSTLFSDNFEAGASNWSVTSGSRDYYLVTDHGSKRVKVYNNGATTSRVVAGSATWTDYSYQATLNIDPSSTGSASILARVQDNTHLYFFGYNVALGEWMIAKRNGSAVTILATSAPFAMTFGKDYTVRADLVGGSLKLYANGALQVSTTDATYTSGKIGFTATNAIAEIDDVVVTKLTAPAVVPAASSAAQAASWQSVVDSFSAWFSSEDLRRRLSNFLYGG